jgi:oxygen-independent coproporphyrinogen-3 oxidase
LNQELVNLFNKPGPYYSSYPTLNNWKKVNKKKQIDYFSYLKEFFKNNPEEKIYLYLHIPYCAQLCYYCACNIHISKNRQRINAFVQCLLKEIELYENFFSSNNLKPNFTEVHLGGGTPSHLTTKELSLIINAIAKFVDISNLKEFAMEIDPRTVNEDHFDEYAKLGVDRISFGVQDFDENVQKKINRVQPFTLVKKLMDSHLRKKFKGVNFDLLYGLPGQSKRTFEKTIELTNQLKPERITLIKYAHIPNKRKHMKMIDVNDLPHEKNLPEMFVNSTNYLTKNGYEWVGIDHFALKNDELAISKKNKNVKRNFGGETPGFSDHILGLGPTSTSAIGSLYAQSTYDLKEYISSVENNNIPLHKFYHLSNEDEIRRYCNYEIQCNQFLEFEKVEKKFNINFTDYFSNEIKKLKNFENKGFININQDSIEVNLIGRFFVRHICQVFDKFLDDKSDYEIHGP